MLHLTPRLSAVAGLVRPCETVADIGTDHAYVPAFLLQTGVAQRAIAADIHEKPLENAKKTLERFGLLNQAELRLSDGLQGFRAGEAQAFVIAGMGGEQIAAMLYAASWLQAPEIQLVLQPMTHGEDVRRALRENGFSRVEELTVAEGSRLYLVLLARWTGEIQSVSPAYDYIGALCPQARETDRLFLQRTAARLQKKADALRGKDPATAKKLDSILQEVYDACR